MSRAQDDGRSRRRADALRLLPVLGTVLVLLPDLILSGGPAAEGATASWGAYLFAAWAGLIALAAWLARPGARRPHGSDARRPDDPDAAGAGGARGR